MKNISKIVQTRRLTKKIVTLLEWNDNGMTNDIQINLFDEMTKQSSIDKINDYKSVTSSTCWLWVRIGQNGPDTWQRFKKVTGVSKVDINDLMKSYIICDVPVFDDGTLLVKLDLTNLVNFLKDVQSDAVIPILISNLIGQRDDINETIKVLKNNL